MFGLIYKELLANKKQFFPVLFVTAFCSFFMVVPPIVSDMEQWEVNLTLSFSSIIIALVVEMFQQGIFEHDERKVWQSFICSTSDGIKNQISSKYIFNLFISSMMFCWCTFLFYIAAAVSNHSVTIAGMILQLIVFIQIFFRAFETPFIIRFGSKKGNIIRMVFMGTIVLIVLIYALFGDLSIFGSIEDLIKWFQETFTESIPLFLRLIPACVLFLYWVSYKISCVLYLKGGESYEK